MAARFQPACAELLPPVPSSCRPLRRSGRAARCGAGLGQASRGADAGKGQRLTGSCSGKLCIAVGVDNSSGTVQGAIVEHDGSKWTKKTGSFDILNGVYVSPDGTAVAVGYSVWKRATDGTWTQDNGAPVGTGQFHGAYVDPVGGIWTAGGDLFNFTNAQLGHYGSKTIPKPTPPGAQ